MTLRWRQSIIYCVPDASSVTLSFLLDIPCYPCIAAKPVQRRYIHISWSYISIATIYFVIKHISCNVRFDVLEILDIYTISANITAIAYPDVANEASTDGNVQMLLTNVCNAL